MVRKDNQPDGHRPPLATKEAGARLVKVVAMKKKKKNYGF